MPQSPGEISQQLSQNITFSPKAPLHRYHKDWQNTAEGFDRLRPLKPVASLTLTSKRSEIKTHSIMGGLIADSLRHDRLPSGKFKIQ